jgi:hypothetical protein
VALWASRVRIPSPAPNHTFRTPATALFCSKCAAAVDLKAAMEIEDKRARADEIMNRLINDPEVRKLLTQKIKEPKLTA